MNYIIVLSENGVPRGRLSTVSPSVYLNDYAFLVGGGVRVNTSQTIGMIYVAETRDVKYINPTFAGKNQADPVVRDFLQGLKKRLDK